jgi:hypothetical protein
MKTIFQNKWLRIIILLQMVVFAYAGQAQTIAATVPSNVSAPFLFTPSGAIAGGQGNMTMATAPNSDDIFYSTAKVIFNNDDNALVGGYKFRNANPDNVSTNAIGGFYKTSDNGAFTADVQHFIIGTTNLQPQGYDIGLGYSIKLGSNTSIGARLHYSSESITQARSTLLVSDLSTDISGFVDGRDDNGEGITLGFSIDNIGRPMDAAFIGGKKLLPLKSSIGASYTAIADDDVIFTTATEFSKLLVPPVDPQNSVLGLAPNMQFSFGEECNYKNLLFVRSGLSVSPNGDENVVTVGLGIRLQNMMINTAYLIPFASQNFPSIARVSFVLFFQNSPFPKYSPLY